MIIEVDMNRTHLLLAGGVDIYCANNHAVYQVV